MIDPQGFLLSYQRFLLLLTLLFCVLVATKWLLGKGYCLPCARSLGGGGRGWTQGEKLDGKVSFKQSFSRTRSLIPQSKDWIGHPYDQSTDPRVYDVV